MLVLHAYVVQVSSIRSMTNLGDTIGDLFSEMVDDPDFKLVINTNYQWNKNVRNNILVTQKIVGKI